jgi:hypothetical protein
MFRRLMVVGGILNSGFFLFHVFVGYELTHLASPHRALLEAFNLVGTLVIGFFAYASFVHHRELLETGLGHAVLGLASLIFLSRAAEEFILFKFRAPVFASCFVVGALYAVALVVALRRKSSASAQPRTA